ncbi:MAG TPA: amidohydrolase family protein [Candidatus Atribacteria bacterium]|nr:amidohydrolase family protein [Candidatus Atribacteria bacterium]
MFDFKGIPVIDAHFHIMGGADRIELLKKQKERYGYDRVNVLSLEATDGLQNAKCITYKLMSPGDYAFAGLSYNSDEDFLSQAKALYNLGFDGFKMIEGKPGPRKKTGIPLNDSVYDPFYSFCEENGIPVLLHAADTAVFWDESKAPSFAKESGWLYTDGTFLSKEEITREVIGVLEKHRQLKLILAHFFFMSDDLKRAGEMFDRYPNLCFDITPGTEMYIDFARDTAAARAFFEKYQDRIIFGTDNYDVDPQEEKEIKDVINSLMYSFLFEDKPFRAWDLELHGIGLDREALDKILHRNFERLTPLQRVDKANVIDFIANELGRAHKTEEVKEIRDILALISDL